jgi:hypothetical protein
VALKAYQDDPLYIRHFNIEGLDVYDEPVMTAIPLENPITKGRSQAVDKQQFKPFLAASNLALKCIKARLDIMMSTKSGRAASAGQWSYALEAGRSVRARVRFGQLQSNAFSLRAPGHQAWLLL